MFLSKNKPRNAADRWVREHMHFKGEVLCVPCGPDEATSGRFVEVRYKKVFLVLKLLVVGEDDVRVLKDRQEQITAIALKHGDQLDSRSKSEEMHVLNIGKILPALIAIRIAGYDWFEAVEICDTWEPDRKYDVRVMLKGKAKGMRHVDIKLLGSKEEKADFNKKLTGKELMHTITLISTNVWQISELKPDLLFRFKNLRIALCVQSEQ